MISSSLNCKRARSYTLSADRKKLLYQAARGAPDSRWGIVATDKQLRIEYHPASDGPHTKTPDDAVTVDLTTRKLAHFHANDLGHPQAARAIRAMR